MSKPRVKPPVTVTVRPDGTWFVEKQTSVPREQLEIVREGRRPIAASLKSTLLEAGALAAAVKTVAPSLGPYGTLAALGFGLLRSLATPEPPPRALKLRRVRIPKEGW